MSSSSEGGAVRQGSCRASAAGAARRSSPPNSCLNASAARPSEAVTSARCGRLMADRHPSATSATIWRATAAAAAAGTGHGAQHRRMHESHCRSQLGASWSTGRARKRSRLPTSSPRHRRRRRRAPPLLQERRSGRPRRRGEQIQERPRHELAVEAGHDAGLPQRIVGRLPGNPRRQELDLGEDLCEAHADQQELQRSYVARGGAGGGPPAGTARKRVEIGPKKPRAAEASPRGRGAPPRPSGPPRHGAAAGAPRLGRHTEAAEGRGLG